MAGRGDGTDSDDNFTYDAAVYYENDDSKKDEILNIRSKLEEDRWGFTLCDPYRDGDGTQMGRFEHSANDSRHAIIFLSPSLLERMERKEENHTQFKMETFLSNLLDRHDSTLKQKVIPIMFETDGATKPFILGRYTPLCPQEVGFWRKLYRAVSRLPVPDDFSAEMSKRLKNLRHLPWEAVLHIADRLGLPPEVVKGIKEEYGGSMARLREVFYCWKSHLGLEATINDADEVIKEATSIPRQVHEQFPEQSLIGVNTAELPDLTSPIITQTSSACPSLQEPQSSSMQAPPDDTQATRMEALLQRAPAISQGFNSDEQLSDGLRTLNLNTQQSCEPDRGGEDKKTSHEERNGGNTAKQRRPGVGQQLRQTFNGRKRPEFAEQFW